MKCYNHQEADAIGICKSCNKGICQNCVTEVPNGIACSATCIEEVNALNALINQNKLSAKKATGVFYRGAFIYGGFGIAFIFYGMNDEHSRSFFLPMGILFCIGSALTLYSGSKYKKKS